MSFDTLSSDLHRCSCISDILPPTPPPPDTRTFSFEYLVKWKAKAYLHCEWLSPSMILADAPPSGKRKIQLFYKHQQNTHTGSFQFFLAAYRPPFFDACFMSIFATYSDVCVCLHNFLGVTLCLAAYSSGCSGTGGILRSVVYGSRAYHRSQ